MGKSTLKSEILQITERETTKSLYNDQFEKLGVSAIAISKELQIDRTNASRNLNKLFNDGKLIKKIGRPTLYVATSSIKKLYPNNLLPKIVPADRSFQEYIHVKPSKSNRFETYLYDLNAIGYASNESFDHAIAEVTKQILFPASQKFLIINGKRGILKTSFIKNISRYIEQYYPTHKSFNMNIENIDSYKEKINEILAMPGNKNIFCCITTPDDQNNIEALFNELLLMIQSNPHKCVFILDTQMHLNNDYFSAFYPIVEIPEYFDFTPKEKVEYCFKFFQEQAYTINSTIKITKNIISCFLLCNMIGNLENLRSIIQKTCMNAYIKQSTKYNVLEITLEDLPNEILNSIEGTVQDIDKYNNVFQSFNNTVFLLFPDSSSSELNTLLSTPLNEKGEIQFLNQPQDILALCQNDLKNFDEANATKILSNDEEFQYIYKIIIEHTQFSDYQAKALAYHLYHSIHQIVNNKYKESSVLASYQSLDIIRKKSTKIISLIENRFDIKLPTFEQMYISIFILLCEKSNTNLKLGVIFCMSSSRLSKVYSYTVNQSFGKDFTTYYDLDFSNFYSNYDSNYESLKETLSKLDAKRGIIILTDAYIPYNLIHRLQTELGVEIRVENNLSNPEIKNIYNCFRDSSSSISSLNTQTLSENAKELEEKNLYDVLSSTIQQQLIFLDANKILPILNDIYSNIVKDLDLDFSNSLLTAFLMHTSFMLERSIKKQPLAYKHLNTLQRKYSNIYNVVYEHFLVIKDIFYCEIYETELAYVVEMFAEFEETKKTTKFY